MRFKYSVSTLAALCALSISSVAAAQGFEWSSTGAGPRLTYGEDRQSFYDARRAAYDEGYREGVKEGEKDARRGERFYYEDEKTWQRADKGYHRSYGDPGRYQVAFRNGYASGYADSYNRLARPGRREGWRGNGDSRYGYGYPAGGYGRPGYGYGYGYANPAIDHGLREGYEKGREDARKNRTFDARRHSWYREGDRHYDDDYGSREAYKSEYRRAFTQGYEQGYRDNRYGW